MSALHRMLGEAHAVLALAAVPPAAREIGALEALLSGAERHRAGSMHHHRRREFVAGRALARALLSELLAISPAEVGITLGRWGRPQLAPEHGSRVSFSLAHAGGHVAAALSFAGSVGADVEPIRPPPGGAVAWSCTAEERQLLRETPVAARDEAFLHLWTVKEALVKAVGLGMRRRFTSVPATLADTGGCGQVAWRSVRPGPRLVAAVAVAQDQLPAEPGLSLRVLDPFCWSVT